jgi:hypothetical protein
MGLVLGDAKIGNTSKLEFFAETLGLETGRLAQLGLFMLMSCSQSVAARQQSRHS